MEICETSVSSRAWFCREYDFMITCSGCATMGTSCEYIIRGQNGQEVKHERLLMRHGEIMCEFSAYFTMLVRLDVVPFSSLQGRSLSASSFYASLLQAIVGVVFLTFCPQVASRAPQHSDIPRRRSPGDVALPASLSAQSFPLHSGMFRTVYPQEFWKMDVGHCYTPVSAFPFQFSPFVSSSVDGFSCDGY